MRRISALTAGDLRIDFQCPRYAKAAASSPACAFCSTRTNAARVGAELFGPVRRASRARRPPAQPGTFEADSELVRIAAFVFLIMVGAGCSSSGSSSTAPKPTSTTVSRIGAPVTIDLSATAGPCRTEASSFQTAVGAYKAMHGSYPNGNAQAVAAVLAGAQLLQSNHLAYNDTHRPPASVRWYYDAAAHDVVHGAHCG